MASVAVVFLAAGVGSFGGWARCLHANAHFNGESGRTRLPCLLVKLVRLAGFLIVPAAVLAPLVVATLGRAGGAMAVRGEPWRGRVLVDSADAAVRGGRNPQSRQNS